MSRDEAYQVLQKYDAETYQYYIKNAWYFGTGAYRYAEKLKRENEEIEAVEND